MTAELTISHQDAECKNCRIRRFFNTQKVECHEKTNCQWVVKSHEYRRYCEHPSALHYAKLKARKLA